MQIADRQIGFGVIGLGWFSFILIEACRAMEEIKLVAAADPVDARRAEARARFGIPRLYSDYRELLDDPEVSIVAIVTPPHTHFPISVDALTAGKHVFVEKPGALHAGQMNEVISLAESKGLKSSIDYVMRHNPLYLSLRDLVRNGRLGRVEYACLHNYAHDDHLVYGHWFWDREKSGGIWTEHGVHFFDLANWMFGRPVEISAQDFVRQNHTRGHMIRDRCAAVAVYPDGTICSFYHGFTKPERFEKTTFSFAFERGYAEISGWIPTDLRLTALVEEEMIPCFESLPVRCSSGFGGKVSDKNSALRVEHRIARRFRGADAEFLGGGKAFHADAELEMVVRATKERWEIYRECIRAGMRDLLRAIRETDYVQKVTLKDARDALFVAEAAVKSGEERRLIAL